MSSTTHKAPHVALTAVECPTCGQNAWRKTSEGWSCVTCDQSVSTNAEPVELDETIAVAAWVRDVRRELAEFNDDGGDLFVNVRGVVALARATAERIGHPVTGDLLWWARALDRWANRAREKDARIAELTAELAAERERTAAAQRLPVLPRCSDCGWYDFPIEGAALYPVCLHPRTTITERIDEKAHPPSACPLRGRP